MSHTQWGAERTVGININGEDVRVIEIAETAKPYDDFSTIGYAFSSEHADMITKAINSHQAMKEALEEIAKGEGPYSRDLLEHASNTIEAMKELARKALTLANGGTSE